MCDFNTPLTPLDISTEQKINKKTQTLNDTMGQLDIIYIYRTFYSKTISFTFFSRAHRTFRKIDHILGHKPSHGKLKKQKKMKSFQSSSNHSAVRLELNFRGKKKKLLKI